MARVQLHLTKTYSEPPRVPVSVYAPPIGATATVDNAGGGAATVYAAETGGTTVSDPLTVDNDGYVIDSVSLDRVWVEAASYDITVSGDGIITTTIRYEAIKGGDVTEAELAIHTGDVALDGGIHGLPALTADGMAWVRQGGALVAVDVATQAELETERARLLAVESGHIDALVTREAPLNPRHPEYGAVGDAVADDTAALVDAVAACPTGSKMILPGMFRVTSTFTIDKAIEVEGDGIGTGLKIDLANTATDGVTFGKTSLLSGFRARNFSVIGGSDAGAAVCQDALVVKNLYNSTVEDIWVRAKTNQTDGWGISVEGGLDNYFKLTCVGGNLTFPHTTGRPLNGIRLIHSGQYQVNASWFLVYVASLAGVGFLMDGTAGSFNNWVEGVVEGCTGLGVHFRGCSRPTLDRFHLEAAAGQQTVQNGLRVEGCVHARLGSGLVYGPTTLIDSTDTDFAGPLELAGGVSEDEDCVGTRWGTVKIGSAAPSLLGEDAFSAGVFDFTVQTNQTPALPGLSDPENLIPNGNLEGWNSNATPIGGVLEVGSGSISRQDTATAPAPFPGKSVAKLITTGANQELRGIFTEQFQRVRGRRVVVYAWVYVASGQGTDPQLSVRSTVAGGASPSTYTSPVETRRDGWQRLALCTKVPSDATSFYMCVMNTAAAGEWFVGALGVAVGRNAPRLLHPTHVRRAIGEQLNWNPPSLAARLTGTATWNPASLADGAVSPPVAITVTGATVGDTVEVGFPLLVGAAAAPAGILLSGQVTAANTVSVVAFNKSGGAVDLDSGTVTARVGNNAMTSTTVTAYGAVMGDVVMVGFSNAVPAGVLLVGAVTAADTITVTLYNKTAAAVDLASGTLRAEARGV